MNIWMVYTWNMKGLEEVEQMGRTFSLTKMIRDLSTIKPCSGPCSRPFLEV